MAIKAIYDPGSFQLDMDAYRKQQEAYADFNTSNPAIANAMKTQNYAGLTPWQANAAKSNDWNFLSRFPTADAYRANIQAQNQAMQNTSPEQIAAARANYNATMNYANRDNTAFGQLPTSGSALTQSFNPAQQAQAALNRPGMPSTDGRISTFQNSPAFQYSQTLGSNGGQTAQQYFDSTIGLNAQGQPNRAITAEESRRIYDLARQEGLTAEQINDYMNLPAGAISDYIAQQGWDALSNGGILNRSALSPKGAVLNQGGGQSGGGYQGNGYPSYGGTPYTPPPGVPGYTPGSEYRWLDPKELEQPLTLWGGLLNTIQNQPGGYTSGNMGHVSPYWNPAPYMNGWANDAFGTGYSQLAQMIANPPQPVPQPSQASEPTGEFADDFYNSLEWKRFKSRLLEDSPA